ncbi:gluconate 2-dehydrogenase subunit 3 family protein [Anaeromyxobacter diazotrophicus]|uniref:Gluconate 2-dehydrogenase subunit 3 family protein n=1 Tax=Anaeromyxobacter diazotrophicus TaxID=2590199 RepID=A0A7I9VK76_9BACT|nr:gluconate 2-dehydrogenase subunit 3 family protein [Anaeromyxobacter diazotrophicus]GEJ56806.1 hypothetical protein AMYX_15470 [Anaeromyxobacter diazotrophicus]
MSRRRPPPSLALPGEPQSRRSFLRRGLFGAALLALGSAGFFATRKTRLAAEGTSGLEVLSPEEASVLLAVADRLVPERPGFPRPRALGLAARMDAVVAMAHPATQLELKRLVRLFESAAAGLLLDRQPRTFTASSAAEQDLRLDAWAKSRFALRRTGFHALKRLVHASYYASPETWAAVGYPGPPIRAGLAGERAR